MSNMPPDPEQAPPSQSPKILSEDVELLTRAVNKWISFHKNIWYQINFVLENEIKRSTRGALFFRVFIILLSASVTTISDIDLVPRTVVTIIAGILTASTGIEAFLKLAEQRSNAQKQQREIENLRDELRFEWFAKVEIEGNMKKRIAAAKGLMEEGPKRYNEILNKYVLKAQKGESPKMN